MSRNARRGRNQGGKQSGALGLTVTDARGRTRKLAVPSKQLGWEWREQGQQILVFPSASARWSGSSTLWRSVLLRRTPQGLSVLSVGLPKFWGPQENPGAAQALESEVAAGEQLQATVKADGQLLIRSVYGERVLWRTRTNIILDEALQDALAPLLAAYPALADPAWESERSLQFELCLARQRIVVAYPHDRLILVGASSHANLEPRPWIEVTQIAASLGCEVARTLPLAGASVREWSAQVEEWARAGLVDEGVVLRDESGYPRLRLKSSVYERAFRLRYDYPPAALYRCWQKERGRKKATEVEAAVFKNLAVAPEDVRCVRESLAAFATGEENVNARCQELQAVVGQARGQVSRSQFAKSVNASYDTPEGPALLSLWDGDEAAALVALGAHALNRLCERLSAASSIAASSIAASS